MWFWKNKPEALQPLITEEEAIARAREYAEANGMLFREPFSVHIQNQLLPGTTTQKPARRPVYVIRTTAFRPMTTAEVDGLTGSILEWRWLPR